MHKKKDSINTQSLLRRVIRHTVLHDRRGRLAHEEPLVVASRPVDDRRSPHEMRIRAVGQGLEEVVDGGRHFVLGVY